MEVLRQASFKIQALPRNIKEKFESKEVPGVTKLPKGFDSGYIETEKSKTKRHDSVKTKTDKESEEVSSVAVGRTILELEEKSNKDPSPCKEKLLELFDSFKFASLEVKDKVEAKCVRFFKNEDAVQIEAELDSDSERTIEQIIDEDYSIVDIHDLVILVGGAKESSSSVRAQGQSSTVNVYDSRTQEWRELPPLPVEVTACSACQVPGVPAFVVIGGYGKWRALNTIQLFDWVKQEWQLIPPMRKRRWGSVSVPTDHGVVVVGGCDRGSVLRSMELHSFKRKEWFTLPPMQRARCNFGGAVIGKKLFVVGGGTGFYFNSATDTVECFNGETGKWTFIAAMRHKRYGCTAIEWQGNLTVIGGCDEHGVDIAAVEVYAPTNSEWSELAPLPVGLSLCRAITMQNRLVAFGADGSSTQAYAYDFDLDRWETFFELPLGRNAFSAIVLGI